jgi:trans-aconitate 2-methyltransferase
VLAVDGSESMIEKAREAMGDRAAYLVTDLSELEAPEPVDVVFSTATFHWIPDHAVLFARIHDALAPGGRLHAQCGGEGNVAKHAEVVASVSARPEFAEHYAAMDVLWNFAGPEETSRRLEDAGFTDVRCSLEPKEVRPEDPRAFIQTVTLGPHLALLPEAKRDAFVDAVLEESAEPLTLDYVRLNMEARKPA